jgi:outer membrane lipoprotein-sorting protein
MRKILTAMFLLLSIGCMAQNAKQILDATATKIRQMGDVKATFTATSFNGTVEQASTKGTMLLQGKKMQLATDEMKMWYNGKTQWSLMSGSNEVNVSTPTEREMASMNPYSFLGFYKKGYKMKVRQTKLRGKDVYEVHLLARSTNNNEVEMYVDVAKNDFIPLCIRIRQDNQWNRISIHSIQGNQHFSDSDFEFPKNDYPNVDIIDLR